MLLRIIVHTFLYLDQLYEMNYFNASRIRLQGAKRSTSNAIFRMNKLLYLLQISWWVKNKELLFHEQAFVAYLHGPVMYAFNKNASQFLNAHAAFILADQSLVTSDLYNWMKKLFLYFSKYSNLELEQFVHQDYLWTVTFLGRGPLDKDFKMYLNQDYWHFYQNHWIETLLAIESVVN